MADEYKMRLTFESSKKVDAGNIFARLVKANPTMKMHGSAYRLALYLKIKARLPKTSFTNKSQNQYAKKAIANLEIASVLEVPSQDEPISNISKNKAPDLIEMKLSRLNILGC